LILSQTARIAKGLEQAESSVSMLPVPQRLPRWKQFEERERRVQHQAELLLSDDHRLLPRFLDLELQKHEDAARIARILIEGGEIPPEANGGKPLQASADGHRDDRRRGLPMIGRGVTGATTDTNPVRALLEKERRAGR
jgi:hypothetical protein